MGLSGQGKFSPSTYLEDLRPKMRRPYSLYLVDEVFKLFIHVLLEKSKKFAIGAAKVSHREFRILYFVLSYVSSEYAGGPDLKILLMRGAKLGVSAKSNFGLSCIGLFQSRRWPVL